MKDVINILGGDKQKVQSEHKEFYNFVKALPNSNWQVWAAKQYKNDPNGFKQYKDDLIHFSGSIHIKDIADHRFDNKIHDSWEKGINALKEKENKYVEKIKQNQYLIKPSKRVKEIVSIDDNWGWFDLGVPYCTEEGEAMGHCGNRPGHVKGDRILSLRKKVRIGNEVYHEPHLTFVEHEGYLGEMKGKGNQKPSSKYHPYIVKLLEHKSIKGVVGGGHLSHQNFSINDLSSQHRERLLAKKPTIDVWKSEQDHVLPDKFKAERELIQWMRNYKNKYRDNWKRQFLEDIKNGAFKKAPSTLLNLMDYHGQDRDVLRHLLVHADNIDAKLAIHAGALARDKELKDIVWSSANSNLQAGLLSGIYVDAQDVDKALEVGDNFIAKHAIKSNAFDARHMDKALGHDFSDVRVEAVKSPHFGPEHMSKVLSDKDEFVRLAAVASPHFGPDHAEQGLKDSNRSVRNAVVKRIKSEPEKFKKIIEKYPDLFKK